MSDQEELLADPAMLVLARDSRGWTQSELAEQMSHVEGNRISQGYEAGPKPDASRSGRSGSSCSPPHFASHPRCCARPLIRPGQASG